VITIGLTGGIGMGKSTVANMFAAHSVPFFNADETVHRLQGKGGRAIPALAAAFPGTVRDGVLDRAQLREIVFADEVSRHRLERLMHPMVRAEEKKFHQAARRAGRRRILLDIPLLFETGSDRRVDITITVSCPRAVQIARVARRGLSRPQIERIIARQMPDAEKRRRADYVIPTGLSKFNTIRAVRRILKALP
jgi:dephospho-CoA kinase